MQSLNYDARPYDAWTSPLGRSFAADDVGELSFLEGVAMSNDRPYAPSVLFFVLVVVKRASRKTTTAAIL